MAEEYSQCILIKVVAQICQMVGFEKITPTPLFVLADILKGFISKLGRIALQYAEHCGHSNISINDLSIAFWDCGISPKDLAEFLKIVSPLPKTISVPKFPVKMKNSVLDSAESDDLVRVEDVETCNQQKVGDSKDSLKIKISLSKINVCKIKKSKNKKHKKKKKKENETR